MSLTKLLLAPVKLFKKDVITFLIIRRHDLGCMEEKLRYIAVRSNASIFTLRQKVWHLLDLPDYCDEVIVLKAGANEIPLTALRKGNDPQQPYVLEVWWPDKRLMSSATIHHMLTMGRSNDSTAPATSTDSVYEERTQCNGKFTVNDTVSQTMLSKEALVLNKLRFMKNNPTMPNFMQSECKKSELSCRISSSSLIFKMQGRKSKDNFATVLLRIQNDLSNLSNKLSTLESRIPT